MSFHEAFLNETFFGIGVLSALGMVVTIGIALSCICRLNAMQPRLFITSEQALYLLIAFWAMEAFTDILFLQMFSGHDLAIGGGVMLYLHSTYKDWAGEDCVSDTLNLWRRDHRMRMEEIRHGHKYGRRASDQH